MHSATVISRMPMSLAPYRAVALVALAVLACLCLAACSPGADYPSLFPSVHDVPPPRADAPLDSNQVQQATEDLITARDRLTGEAQAKSSTGSSGSPAKAAANAKTGTKSAPKSAGAAAGGSAGKASGNAATAADTRQPLGTDAAPVGGTETK